MKAFRYHLVGIGGVGMSAIARVLLDRGFAVSGSDLRRSRLTDQLSALGAKIFIGHDEANLNGADAVVFSSAVKSDNPEVAAAVRNGLQVLSRGEMLGKLMRGTFGIAVAGTHGKTTTTGMVATVLSECG
ncbi:MAG: Mur ligase domain-containing protein, partial [Armatimonadota bacterium]